jgi:excinuclease ABC subunit C
LQYQIRRCPAPCVHDVDRDEYGEQVRTVALFLEGRHDELVRELDVQMSEAAQRLDYERAAIYRDQLRAVERVREEQRVAVVKDTDQDVVGLYRQADQAEAAMLLVRGGRLTSVRTYGLKDVSLPDDELVASFVAEYYGHGSFVPDEVLLPTPIEAMEGLAAVLGDRKGRKVQLKTPRRGPRAKLLRMAMDNAAHAYKEKRRSEQDVQERLGHVMARLQLPSLPRRIECIDVSHLAGQDTVAAVVSLFDGAPDKARYRSFHVSDVPAGDDYAAMYQVLSRRLRRGRDKERNWELPDLLVVDGGKGQLNMALAALADLGVDDLPVASIAKEKEDVRGELLVDRIYRPGRKNPVPVRSTPALSMLALARDEAHRASNALRIKRGKKRSLSSALDEVQGVGPKTRTRLLRRLGSLSAVTEASVDDLVSAGATRRQARSIWQAFHGPEPAASSPADADPHLAEDRAVDNAFDDDAAAEWTEQEAESGDGKRPPGATAVESER